MPARFRLLKGATVLLYLGPLVAGMSGFGWGMVLPFVLIFVLWLIILRPEQWPATFAGWLTLQAFFAALAQMLSQLLLVAVLFGVGRGIGGIAGFLLIVNPLLPLSISFLAIPLCRLIWDARIAAERGEFLDEDAEAAQILMIAAKAALDVRPLIALPDDCAEEAVWQAIVMVLEGSLAPYRLDALGVALQRSERSHTALRRSLVIWATEPEIVAPGSIPHAVNAAFLSTNRNPDLLRLFLPRALALVAAFPNRVAGFPSASTLRDAAEGELQSGPHTDLPVDLRADLKDGLIALAWAVEAVAKGSPSTA